MLRRRLVCVVGAATLLLAGSACTTKSLDVEAGAPSTEPRTTATEREDPASTTTLSVPSSSTTTVAPAPTDVEQSDSPTGGPGSRAGQCPTELMVEDLQKTFGEDLSGLPPSDAMNAGLDLLGLYVPPELMGDFQIMRDAVLQMFTALEKVGPDPSAITPEQIEEFLADLQAVGTPETEAASQRVEDYFTQVCPGLDWIGGQFEPADSVFD